MEPLFPNNRETAPPASFPLIEHWDTLRMRFLLMVVGLILLSYLAAFQAEANIIKWGLLGLQFVVLLVGSWGVTRMVHRVHKDIIEQITSLDAELTKHQKSGEFLLNQQQFIDKMLTAIPDSVYVYDLVERRSIYTNREITHILGYEIADLAQMGSNILEQLFHPEDYVRQTQSVNRFDDAQDGEVLLSEYRLRHKNGDYRWIAMRDIVFQRDADGKPHLILGVGRDITEQRLMEQKTIAFAMASERSQMLAHVMSSISHDIRTPLSVIGTSVYLLGKTDDPAKRREREQIIDIQIQRISDLADQFYELARVQRLSGIQASPVNLNKLVEAVHQSILQEANEKQITLTHELDPNLPSIQGDEFYLHTALRQIIDNALRYTPKQGQISIRTHYNLMDLRVELTVTDTGVGITAEDLPHIFEPFYKADKARTFDHSGAGLGLSVVKRIVDLHQGEIRIDSVFGAGTTILLYLSLPSPTAD